MIVENIEANLGGKVDLRSVKLRFPFILEIADFSCDYGTFSRVDVRPIFLNPFSKTLIMQSVYISGLKLKITKDKQGVTGPVFLAKISKPISGGQAGSEMKQEETAPVQKVKASPWAFKIKKLTVSKGSVEFTDSSKDNPLVVKAENINMSLRGITYPLSSKFYLKLTGSLRTENGVAPESIKISGWIDYPRKNMDVDFNVEPINYAMFSEHYPNSWKPDNTGIENAEVSLKTKMVSYDNDLVIEGSLSLDKLSFLGNQGDSDRQNLLRTVVALIQAGRDKATVNFKLKTKMDAPVLDFSPVKKNIAGSMLFKPGVIAGQAAGKALDITEGAKEITVDNVIDTIKDVGDMFEGMFKQKDSQEQPASITGSE
jgi:hypothetical protein